MTPVAPKRLPVIACGAAVIRRGREFLIAQRHADDTFGSYWEFPGGKKNPGETFEDCARRETLEELGVRVAVRERLADIRRPYRKHLILLRFFLCDYLSGEPKPLDCQAVRWADVMQLRGYRFPPANGRILRMLEKRYGR